MPMKASSNDYSLKFLNTVQSFVGIGAMAIAYRQIFAIIQKIVSIPIFVVSAIL